MQYIDSAQLRCQTLQWWLVSPCISFQFLKAHPWDAAHFVEQKGHLRSSICFFSLLMFSQLFLFHCSSLSCSISKLSHCRWLVEFDIIGEHVYNFKWFLLRFLVWHGAMCQVCFLKLWNTPVMTYFTLYIVPIPESTSMDAAHFVEEKGHLRSSIRLFSRLLFGELFLFYMFWRICLILIFLTLFDTWWIWYHTQTCVDLQIWVFFFQDFWFGLWFIFVAFPSDTTWRAQSLVKETIDIFKLLVLTGLQTLGVESLNWHCIC